MPTTLTVAGIDLETDLPGVAVTELPDLLFRSRTEADTLAIPGVAGDYLAGPTTVPAREFSVGVWVDGGTVAGNRDLLDQLATLIGSSTVPIESADLPGVRLYARLIEAKPVAVQPAHVNPWTSGELRFRADYPYWRETWAQWIGFGTSYVPLPVWNAPTAPIYEIWGPATTPIDLIHADHAGTVLRTTRLSITLNTDQDFVRIITEAWGMSIWKSVAGTLSQDETLLHVDYLFPKPLESPGGTAYQEHFPMVKLAAGGGTPRGRAYYPRQALAGKRAAA